MRRYLSLVLLIPLAIVLIAFSVANRQLVALSFDPMNTADPAFSVQLPLFFLIFAAIALGLVLGGIGTWFTQGKHRKLARQRRQEAAKWRFEAEKQNEGTLKSSPASNTTSTFPMLPPSKAA